MEKLRKMKNQKGFTLVEVIVVLVILAIMAAILIPSLVGYIDKARENSVITDTRGVVQAVQTLASEAYAKNKAITQCQIGDSAPSTNPSSTGKYTITTEEIQKLAELATKPVTGASGTINADFDGAKIKWLKYKSGDSIGLYKDGKYTIEKDMSAPAA